MKSIESIHEITKAMEMIAAFRFKRAEGRFSKSKIYFGEMERLVVNLSKNAENLVHPLFEKRKALKKTLVVMTGDKGLCGAYNANLLKATASWLKANESGETGLVAVGKIAADFFKKKHLNVVSAYPEKSAVDLGLAKKITAELKTLFLSGKTDSVEFLYTSYRPGGSGRTGIIPFLGLGTLLEKEKSVPVDDTIYEPGFEAVFISLVEKYLEAKTYLCLLESLVSETSARRVAMKQATENGEEVLDHLKLLRNKTRQATITRELSEIVSGASVLV